MEAVKGFSPRHWLLLGGFVAVQVWVGEEGGGHRLNLKLPALRSPPPSMRLILEVALEREPGSGSIHFSAYVALLLIHPSLNLATPCPGRHVRPVRVVAAVGEQEGQGKGQGRHRCRRRAAAAAAPAAAPRKRKGQGRQAALQRRPEAEDDLRSSSTQGDNGSPVVPPFVHSTTAFPRRVPT